LRPPRNGLVPEQSTLHGVPPHSSCCVCPGHGKLPAALAASVEGFAGSLVSGRVMSSVALNCAGSGGQLEESGYFLLTTAGGLLTITSPSTVQLWPWFGPESHVPVAPMLLPVQIGQTSFGGELVRYTSDLRWTGVAVASKMPV